MTHHEGRVVLDESIGTTRHYFDLGGVCGQSGQKAEEGGEREEFGEHRYCVVNVQLASRKGADR